MNLLKKTKSAIKMQIFDRIRVFFKVVKPSLIAQW